MAHVITAYDAKGVAHETATDVRTRAYDLFDHFKAAIDAGESAIRYVEMRTDGLLHAQHGDPSFASTPEPEPEAEAESEPEPAPAEDAVLAEAPAPEPKPKRAAPKKK